MITKNRRKHTHTRVQIIYNNVKKRSLLASFKPKSWLALTFHKMLKSEQCFKHIQEKGACFGLLFSTYIIYYLWRVFIHSLVWSPFFRGYSFD